MASNFTFDPSFLTLEIEKLGLKKTWANLLNTRIYNAGAKFRYILESDFLENSKMLDVDLLEGLTIGEIGVIYEYCVAHVDHNSRKENGQFFTPDDVSKFMAKASKSFETGVWLDPCSGIGNLSWHLVDIQQDKEGFLKTQLLLSDRDPLALEIARVLFTLSFQEKCEKLYEDIKPRFIVFDFLSVADKGDDSLFNDRLIEAIPTHDFVIVNPPYLGLKKEDSRFEAAKAKDLYAYFLENIIKTSRGFISVTPQSFTNAAKFSSIRNMLASRFPNIRIYAFDNIPGNLFFGVKFGSQNSNSANSMRAAITVARQGKRELKITSLLRWKTSERSELFKNINKFLASVDTRFDFFPKVSSVHIKLFNEVVDLPRLEKYISNKSTNFPLYVPSSPRYFISALKKRVERSSMKVLYFEDEMSRNRAYLLLNSSFMYWWWRVRDGGMTLSLETINSLPVPDFKINQKLVSELENSEQTNIVFKKNAGANHENVKHDQALIAKINKLIMPSHSASLLKTHENSELVQLSDI